MKLHKNEKLIFLEIFYKQFGENKQPHRKERL